LWKEAAQRALEVVQKAGVKIYYPDKRLFIEKVKPIYEEYKKQSRMYQLIQRTQAIK